MYLRQATANQPVIVGPAIDIADAAVNIGLTIANTDIRLSKNGAAGVVKNSGGATVDPANNGDYTLTLDDTDTSTCGTLRVNIKMAGVLNITKTFIVIAADQYDALMIADGPLPHLGIADRGTPVEVLTVNATTKTLETRAGQPADSIAPGMSLMIYGSNQGYWQPVVIDSVSGGVLTFVGTDIVLPTGTLRYVIHATPTASPNMRPEVNIKEVNSIPLQGTGVLNDEWEP